MRDHDLLVVERDQMIVCKSIDSIKLPAVHNLDERVELTPLAQNRNRLQQAT